MKTKKLFSVVLAVLMITATLPLAFAADGNTVVLYTNDVHCAIDDYAVLAGYKAQLEAQGDDVILVDAGDAIQGEVIGTLTKGEAVVDIMNSVGYDYAVPGNHEFDYGMETFLEIAQGKAGYKYLSSNFYNLTSVSSVLDPYAIEDVNGIQIAFVGISTPETVSKANPEFFKGEGGNFIYGFPTYDMADGVLCETVQKSVDAAAEEGADIVIAVGHLGILETTDGWKSTDVIAQTNGIDYFIDAHSHETIEKAEYKNKDGEAVFLTSTGTKFANFGQLTIAPDGSADFELINPDEVKVEEFSADAKNVYNTVKSKIDGYKDEIAYLNEIIGESEANLVVYDEDGSWLVRKSETNAGDFCTDAYRAVTGADIAICNGGGIRSEVEIGDVTRKMLMDMNPWSNSMCVVEITGQQLIDVLEHGARSCPEPSGGFFQVSGVTYEIHTYRESPVTTDSNGNFEGIDETKERRIENVLVDGEPVDLGAKYTVAGTQYVLTSGGDGLTMLEGARVVEQEGLLCDSEMLIKYLELLGGTIPDEKYGNPEGDGRIKIIGNNPDDFEYDYEIKEGETITVSVSNSSGEDYDYSYIRFIPESSGSFCLESKSEDEIDPLCVLFDVNLDELDSNDDHNGVNFRLKYDFIKGETYYFGVSSYEESAEFDVTLSCGHSFVDGVCSVCGDKCSHDEICEENLCFCECGKVFFGEDIKENDEVEFDASEYNDYAYYRFVPEKDGLYIFESDSASEESDPVCMLYDSELEELEVSDDVNGYDFFLAVELEKGKTYYYSVLNNCSEASCTLKLWRGVHNADDGTEHSLEFVPETYSTCTEHGHTAALYCSECEEYTWGYEEKEFMHIDDDENSICDECGAEIIYEPECEHFCHSEHWFVSFFWKIVRFFCSILNVEPVCECGAAHY